jgi:hypothetical protein
MFLQPTSTEGELDMVDIKRWIVNLLIFIMPVVLIYANSVLGAINALNGVFAWSIFVPSPLTWGAIVLFLVNSVIDLGRKFAANNNV